jgi:hypothetical protein
LFRKKEKPTMADWFREGATLLGGEDSVNDINIINYLPRVSPVFNHLFSTTFFEPQF